MIGDAYFQLRAQIGTSLFSLTKIARDLEASEASLASLTELQTGLRAPFLFIALGESGVGKSSILNALFGREFTGGAAGSGCTVVFQHGSETRDVRVADDLIEAERHHIFLRDFTIVDSAGLGPPAVSTGILQPFLPDADAVIFVFPVRGAATASWDFLAQTNRDLLRRFIFLIPQADAVEGGELLAKVLAVHDRVMNAVCEPRAIFPVSAQTRAGFEKLERYLDAEIIASPARFQKLREICGAADALLVQLGGKTITASQAASRKLRFVEEHRLALDERKGEALRGLDRHLWSIAQTFEAGQRRGEELLRRRLTQRTLWTMQSDWREQLYREIEERVHEGVARNVQLTGEQCDVEFREAREAHRAALKEAGAGEPVGLADDWPERMSRLEELAARCDPAGPTTASVLDRFAAIRSRLHFLSYGLAGTAVLLFAAVIGSRFEPLCFAIFGVTLAATLLAPWLVRQDLIAVLRRAMRARRETVVTKVEEWTRAEIERVFRAFKTNVDWLEESSAKERAELEPMVNRLHQLAELFDHGIDDIDERQAHANAGSVPPRV